MLELRKGDIRFAVYPLWRCVSDMLARGRYETSQAAHTVSYASYRMTSVWCAINQNFTTMTDYQKRKAAAREKAIDWQYDFANHNYSYAELAYFGNFFAKLARRFGLTREFRENGII